MRGALVETIGATWTPDGARDPVVNLDNAATTPIARPVFDAVSAALELYGSVHRGAGPKSVISTYLYERCFPVIRRFLGLVDDDVVVLATNATTATNRFATRYDFRPDDVVLISEIEHSSNDLPWRRVAKVERFRSTADGSVDLDDLEQQLRRFGRRARIVAVTGASNVTGYMPPIYDIAEITHRYGAELFVDGAQLAAHGPVKMRTDNADRDIDYLVLSGHKMFAPLGVGVVAGRGQIFDTLPPDLPGGGTVEMVTASDQIWSHREARLNPGTPNFVGTIALAASMDMLLALGEDTAASHEAALTSAAMRALNHVPGLTLYGWADALNRDVVTQGSPRRLPIFSFSIPGVPHWIVAECLGRRYHIAVRNGHLCQYEFMRRQLKISSAAQAKLEADLRGGKRPHVYGMVRASGGLSTAAEDFTALGNALHEIAVEFSDGLDDQAFGNEPTFQIAADADVPTALKFLTRDVEHEVLA
jgi:selenocysteine lyase/cysteine desulfurase